MNTKIIVALIAFFTTFGFSSGLTKLFLGNAAQPVFSVRNQTDNAVRLKILNLLDNDIRNGRARDRKIFSVGNPYTDEAAFKIYVTESEKYVSQAAALNDCDLPQDFKTAWREHLQAWHEHKEFIRRVETLKNDDTMRSYRRLDEEITRTWFKTLSVAARHKAYPAYAY